jgi:hypothetical protein
MSTKKRNTNENEDSILQAFDETKGQQMDLLDLVQEKQPKEVKKKKVEKQETIDQSDEKPEDSQEEEKKVVMHEGEDGVLYTEEEWVAPVVNNGPSRQEVEEWKERHGQVYFTPFSNDVFVWRTLQRPEYREIISDATLNALDREEYFTEKCVLYPRNFSLVNIKKSRAGIPSLLSEMIMEKSGFVAQSAPIKL